MYFFGVAMRNVLRRPLRSSLTAVGVGMGVACVLVMLGFSRSLDQGWVATLQERGTHLLAVRRDTADLLTGSLPVEYARKMLAVEGVRSAEPEMVDLISLPNGHTLAVSGWASGSRLWSTIQIEQGRLPGLDERRVAVVGQSAAQTMGLHVGDELGIRGRQFKVVAVFRQNSMMGSGALYVPLADMQELRSTEGKTTAFHVQVDHPEDPERLASVRRRLGEALPDVAFWQTKDVADNSEILNLLRGLAWGMSIIAIAMGALAVLNTLLMSVTERTHEIGVLSAVGWSARRVLGMIVLEGVVICVAGAAAGVAMGVAMSHAMHAHPRLHGFLNPELRGDVLVEALVLALGLCVLASLYPAWRAVRMNTLDAIRDE